MVNSDSFSQENFFLCLVLSQAWASTLQQAVLKGHLRTCTPHVGCGQCALKCHFAATDLFPIRVSVTLRKKGTTHAFNSYDIFA